MNNLKPEDVPEFLMCDYLLKETGSHYCFASSTTRSINNANNIEQKNDGTFFYQIMPDSIDNGFFDWYILEKKHNQFFETKEEAFIQFMKFWNAWKNNQ
jgi:hypothetical protein